ncbi:hypothetical protein DQG13_08270 [Paenibacillus sp. YN15]|nr:hypothetical protein DQG13_08270 [Paenibacillus sp. YN15]
MKLVLFVRMGVGGTIIKIIDRETAEILDDWTDPSGSPIDIGDIVLDASAYAREKYTPERVYFDVDRV